MWLHCCTYTLEKGAIYVAFLLVKINRKKGQKEEKPLFSNPEAVGLIKVQTLMNNDECAWTNICGGISWFSLLSQLAFSSRSSWYVFSIIPQFHT